MEALELRFYDTVAEKQAKDLLQLVMEKMNTTPLNKMIQYGF